MTATNSSTSAHNIILGEELYLECSYVGVPAPTVFWSHNDIELRDGVGDVIINLGYDTISIQIDAVEHTNGGNYTCRANNNLGTDEKSYSVRIVVGKSSP